MRQIYERKSAYTVSGPNWTVDLGTDNIQNLYNQTIFYDADFLNDLQVKKKLETGAVPLEACPLTASCDFLSLLVSLIPV
jgi:hypothetical protein